MPIRKSLIIIAVVFLCFHKASSQQPVEVSKLVAFFQNQQYDDAIAYLNILESKDPNNIQVLGYQAYANRMNDNNPVAENYYRKMLVVDSNNIAALQYLSTDNNTEIHFATLLARRLTIMQPQRPSHKKNLADLFRKVNQRDSAFDYYKQAYELAPVDYRYVAAYAGILLDQKQTVLADSLIDAGLQRDSLNVSYLTLRIRSSYDAKNYQQVLLPGERLMRVGEMLLKPLTNVALAYYNLKMYHDCIRVCDYLLGVGFQVEAVYYYQAKAFAKLSDYGRSNGLLDTCLSIAISNTAEMYYYSLAENSESLRQYKKAVSYYDSAYYLLKNPEMIYNAGRVIEADLKNEKLARKYYSKYLEKAIPKSPDEKKVYEYVKSRMKLPPTGARKP